MRHAQPPIETKNVKIGERVEVAAGVEAITQTLEFTLEEPGAIRGTAALYRLNQFDGYDCPGCAWPDPDEHRSANEYCENGAKAIAEETTSKRVEPDFFHAWSVSDLTTKSDYWLTKQGRITNPMYLPAGSDHYQEVSWDEAFSILARELNALASPDEAIFYTSGRTSNEAAFLYQLFVREFGTNNLPDCSNMCHESSGSALTPTIGIGKGTVTLHDFTLADTILIIGQNPGTNHPRMLTHLQMAARRGANIISVNPLCETGMLRFKHPQQVLHILGGGTRIANHFVQVRINGDLAFFKGVIREILEEEQRRPGEVLNQTFIHERTHGFEEFRRQAISVPWEEIEALSGIRRDAIREIAQVVMRSKTVIACWAMGLTQHKNSVATIQEVLNMLLLGGHLGRPGAGVCPVRGHSNVQGDRTMGIWEKMPDSFLDKLRDTFGFEPPRKHGHDVVASIRAMDRGEAKVFFAMGGNFLSATPDTELTARALAKCNLTVHVSTKLNRAHVIPGKQALILPCLGRTELDMQKSGPQFVSVENSMGIVHQSHGRLEPASPHLLSESMIVARMAVATLNDHAGNKTRIPWMEMVEDYDRIREGIASVVPDCDGYNQKVRHRGGFYLPNGARDDDYKTETGRANFTTSPLTGVHLEAGQFLLMTIRSHDQYNTTIYGLDDRYRGIYNGRRVVLLHEEDMREQGWKEGERLDITSHFVTPDGTEKRTAASFLAVPYDIPRRCAATYFPEANVLVPIGSVAEQSNTPTSKSLVVTFAPSSVPDGVIEKEGVPAEVYA
jgi:molybdopterin-dependent oxidoreductase alpha subunit